MREPIKGEALEDGWMEIYGGVKSLQSVPSCYVLCFLFLSYV